VAGIDEAGRGPLAGPVAAAAVILDPGKLPRGLNDSKQLTSGERDRLYDEILLHASAVSVAFASAAEIDQSISARRRFLAMRRALFALSAAPIMCWIDGNDLPPDLRVPPRRSSRAML